jgi:hypothetical protein
LFKTGDRDPTEELSETEVVEELGPLLELPLPGNSSEKKF